MLRLRRLGTVACRLPLPRAMTIVHTQTTLRVLHGARLKSTAASSKKTKAAKPGKTVLGWGELPTSLVGASGEQVVPLAPFKEVKSKRTKESNPKDDTTPEDREYAQAVADGVVPYTPLSRLVWDNWKRFPDCILLTQVGNFFESYFEPAIKVSALLGIKLTSKPYKTGTFPFTGFPVSQKDKYLKILVQDLGYTVALVEEEKDPLKVPQDGDAVRRSIARIVTPGTLIDSSWLSGSESRYLLSVALPEDGRKLDDDDVAATPLCLAYADVSTGNFFTKAATSAEIEDELARIAPREVVLDARLRDAWAESDTASMAASPSGKLFALLRVLGVHVSFASIVDEAAPSPPLKRTSKDKTVCTRPSLTTNLERDAIALVRRHLEYALRDSLPTLPTEFNRESSVRQMHIDAATLQALEIRTAFRPGGLVSTGPAALSAKGTLLSTLSRTTTDAGARLLRRTLSSPSTHLPTINARLALVAAFAEREHLRADIRDALRPLADVARVLQRFRARSGEGADVWAVARWVRDVQRITEHVRAVIAAEPRVKEKGEQPEGVDRLVQLVDAFAPLNHLADGIEAAIDEASVNRLAAEDDEDGSLAAGDAMLEAKPKGKKAAVEAQLRKKEEAERQRWWIKPSFSTELSDLHEHIMSLEARRDALQERLRTELEAPTLELGVNKRGSFVVNVKKKTQLGRLERSGKFHTLTETLSSKSFAYSEWTALGDKIDKALAELNVAQARALRRLRAMVVEHADAIQANAELVDEIDLTASFAQAAVELNLTRPVLHEGTELEIVNGRHPAVEAGLQAVSRVFTPNTTSMTPARHLHVITGPNQGGKSTLLRQTAVIAILAQSGCFVPADSARIGLVDRVFSRVGARDDLFRDRSTFMLEMVETAAILKHATPRSLVIMDEIGRGTTLHAGISIAYATLDYIVTNIGCRTLFATHYHELARMLGADTGPDSEAPHSTITHIPLDHPSVRPGVAFFCTDVDEMDGNFAYSYRLRPGVNYDSHAIKAAQLAGMPPSFLETAEKTLKELADLHTASRTT